jgi:hypothetical protein
MRKIIAVLLLCLPLAFTPTPTQASVGAYTYVQYANRSGFNERILIKCHSNSEWRTLHIGENSDQKCGAYGWVDSIWVPDGGYLEVQNWTTGNVTQYGNCYKGSIGGGKYYAWVTNFPLNNSCNGNYHNRR